MPSYQDLTYRDIDGPFARTGFIAVPLMSLRIVTSNEILVTATVDAGILSKNTAPILEYTATSTDGAIRIRWAASSSIPLAFQVTLPPEIDPSNNINIRMRAAMGGATNTPTIAFDCYFDVGGTKRTVTSGAVTGTTSSPYSAQIVPASIPTDPRSLSVEITPGAHTTDTLLLYALWLDYTKK